MYKCEFCGAVAPPKSKVRTIRVLRKDRSTLKDMMICPKCHANDPRHYTFLSPKTGELHQDIHRGIMEYEGGESFVLSK